MKENATVATAPEEALEIGLDGVPVDELGEWLQMMLVIREFEESLEALTANGKIPGSVHQASGQEAVAVGATFALGALALGRLDRKASLPFAPFIAVGATIGIAVPVRFPL